MSNGTDSAEKLLQMIFSGALKSARVFDNATGGCRLCDASEHFLTAGIFEKLSGAKGASHLEVAVGECRKEAKAIRQGKPSKKERMNGRYDLVHYWAANELPRAAIEVKNGIRHLNRAMFLKDFKRLATTLTASGDSSYQFCAFVFFATADYTAAVSDVRSRKLKAKERLDTLMSGISDIATEFTAHKKQPLLRRIYSSKTYYSPFKDEGAWNIGMVVFAASSAAGTFPANLMQRV